MSLINSFNDLRDEIKRYNDNHSMPLPVQQHEIVGNRSERIGVLVSSVATILTLIAIYLAYDANRTSTKALLHAIAKDSLDNIQQQKQNIINEQERAENRRAIDASLAIADRNAAATSAAADAAQKNVQLSQKSAAFYRQSVINENRAYIIIDSLSCNPYVVGAKLDIIVHSKNIGKTPAYRITYKTRAFYTVREDVHLFWQGSPSESLLVTNFSFLGSNQSLHSVCGIKDRMTESMLKEMKDNKYSYYVGVEVEYYDIFQKKHFMQFCGLINIETGKGEYCKQFNFTD